MTLQPVEPLETPTWAVRRVGIRPRERESESIPTYGATCPICGGPAIPKQGGGGVECVNPDGCA